MQNSASYSTLWVMPTCPATEDFQPFKTDKEARAMRDLVARKLIAKGFKVKKWTNGGQVRQYWKMGVECGLVCQVYKLDIISRPE